MNNPAYKEKINNMSSEAQHHKACVAAAEDVFYDVCDIHTAAAEWGVSISEIDRYIKLYYM